MIAHPDSQHNIYRWNHRKLACNARCWIDPHEYMFVRTLHGHNDSDRSIPPGRAAIAGLAGAQAVPGALRAEPQAAAADDVEAAGGRLWHGAALATQARREMVEDEAETDFEDDFEAGFEDDDLTTAIRRDDNIK